MRARQRSAHMAMYASLRVCSRALRTTGILNSPAGASALRHYVHGRATRVAGKYIINNTRLPTGRLARSVPQSSNRAAQSSTRNS